MMIRTTLFVVLLGACALPIAKSELKHLVAPQQEHSYYALDRIELRRSALANMASNHIKGRAARSTAFFLGLATMHDLAGNGSEGSDPINSMIVEADTILYGTTSGGGNGGNGTFYKAVVTAGPKNNPTVSYSVLHHFRDGSVANDGSYCMGKLVWDGSGYIYGTCNAGGANTWYGTVYRINTSNGAVTILHSFGGGGNDGANPNGGLVMDGSGNLYGTTNNGGTSCWGSYPDCRGTIFKLHPTGGGSYSYSILHNFTGGTNGGDAPHDLTLASDGNLYGIAIGGGTNGYGIFFKYDLSFNSFSKVLDVPSGEFIWLQGMTQIPTSFTGGALEFWGATELGGAYGVGSVYKLRDTTGSGDFSYTVMHDFYWGTNEGYFPAGNLVFSTDLSSYANYDDAYGGLYGTTWDAGISGYGSLFRIDLSGNFWEFPNEGAWMGSYPNDGPWGLVEGKISSTPVLFGGSEGGGANGTGWLWDVWVQP